ncbi:MAG: CPBP family intramembrane metalloprotease [Alkalicoccus sp.]|nr:MAG: CPBP family intramembrane metalloprotease [Alkalicoccus sp.]
MMRHREKPFLFLLTTLVWTWFFWFAAAFSEQSWLQFPNLILTALGFLGPLIISLLFVKLGFWDGNVKDFIKNNFDIRLVYGRTGVYLLGLILILTGTPLLIGSLVTGESPADLARFSAPGAFLIIGFLAGAVEEPGWRGYAQPAMQRRMSILYSSLVISVFWSLWHLPLFFIEGTYQSTIGFQSFGFWMFHAALIAGSVILGWLYNQAGKLGVIAVLYHGFGNLMREVFSFETSTPMSTFIEFSVEAVIAVVILLFSWGFMTKKQ